MSGRSDLGDHHVDRGPGPAGVRRPRPSSPAARGSRPGARTEPGVGAVLQQAAHQPALGGLVEVADHRAPAVGLVEHPHGDHPPGEVAARGRQNAAYVVDLRSTSSPAPRASRTARPRCARHTPATGPRPGSEASPESRYAGMRSPGRTIPNSEDTTATRLVARRRASAGRPAGRGRRRGRRCRRGRPARSAPRGGRRCGRPGRPARAARPRVVRARSGSARAQLDERVQHLASGVAERRGGQRAQVQRLAAPGGSLALARRQQDQHWRQASGAPEPGFDPG